MSYQLANVSCAEGPQCESDIRPCMNTCSLFTQQQTACMKVYGTNLYLFTCRGSAAKLEEESRVHEFFVHHYMRSSSHPQSNVRNNLPLVVCFNATLRKSMGAMPLNGCCIAVEESVRGDTDVKISVYEVASSLLLFFSSVFHQIPNCCWVDSEQVLSHSSKYSLTHQPHVQQKSILPLHYLLINKEFYFIF